MIKVFRGSATVYGSKVNSNNNKVGKYKDLHQVTLYVDYKAGWGVLSWKPWVELIWMNIFGSNLLQLLT